MFNNLLAYSCFHRSAYANTSSTFCVFSVSQACLNDSFYAWDDMTWYDHPSNLATFTWRKKISVFYVALRRRLIAQADPHIVC